LSSALLNSSPASFPVCDRVATSSPGAPSSTTNEHPKPIATNGKEESCWTFLQKIIEKTYQLATQMIGIAQWFGLVSEDTVTSAKALWSKARSVPAGLVLPPLVLTVMPTAFCKESGLQYLQWIYAASLSLKSASHHGTRELARNGNKGEGYNISTCFSTDQREGNHETYWLQYWIIHTMVVFGGLDHVSSQLPYWFKGLVLWNFWLTVAWIWLLHDSWVVPSMFDVLAAELVGLGLVPDPVDSKTTRYTVHYAADRHSRANILETNTGRFAQYVLKRLPRADTSTYTERDSPIATIGEQKNFGLLDAREESSGDQYPALILASSSLSSESSVSCTPSSSPFAGSAKKSDDRESAAYTSPSSTSDCSAHALVRTKERRKKMLLRYRQQRSKHSSPINRHLTSP